MKFHGGRREWALGIAFMLSIVFLYVMYFFTSFNASPERMLQVQVSSLTGCIAGVLFLPFILPLGALRADRRPSKYFQRLVVLGFLFFPNIILLFLGLNSWLTNPVNVAVRGITNGVIMALVHGLFFSLAGKHRNLWAGFSLALGFFFFFLIFCIQQHYQGDFIALALFYCSGLIMMIIPVFLYLYFSAFTERSPGDKEDQPGMSPLVMPGKKRHFVFLFPLLAMAVIFWANSFTEQLFMPVLHLPSGFHLTNVIMMIAMPVGGFLADRFRQKFFNIFIYFSFGVFLLAPSLLQFNHSETIFFVLYILNVILIQLIFVTFPFAILDSYWRESKSSYWAYLLAISMYLLRVLASAQIGLFSSFPFNSGYSVLLLSLVVIVYFVLSCIFLKLQIGIPGVLQNINSNDANPIMTFAVPEDSFREHGLSKREMEIGFLILQGKRNIEIGKRLFIEEVTVKKHINSIFDKYKVKRRPEFMALFVNKK
jgi:DNA-binding CsgD family transcriptional regulator